LYRVRTQGGHALPPLCGEAGLYWRHLDDAVALGVAGDAAYCEAAGAEQGLELPEAPLTAVRPDHHGDVRTLGLVGMRCVLQDVIDDDEPACVRNGPAHTLQQRAALLVVPVVQNLLEQVEVRHWHRLEETATDQFDAPGQRRSRNAGSRQLNGAREVVQNAARARILLQYREQQVAHAATEVGNGDEGLETVVGKQETRDPACHEAHEAAEQGRPLGALDKVLEDRLAELQLERRALLAHAAQQL